MKVLLLFLILQYLVRDVRIQYNPCGQLELGMQLTLRILINLIICGLHLLRIFFVDEDVHHVRRSLFIGVVRKEAIVDWPKFVFLFQFLVAFPVQLIYLLYAALLSPFLRWLLGWLFWLESFDCFRRFHCSQTRNVWI